MSTDTFILSCMSRSNKVPAVKSVDESGGHFFIQKRNHTEGKYLSDNEEQDAPVCWLELNPILYHY